MSSAVPENHFLSPYSRGFFGGLSDRFMSMEYNGYCVLDCRTSRDFILDWIFWN
jgi:hypothetical protein